MHGLVATDETGLTRQDVLEQQLVDIRFAFVVHLCFSPDFETLKDKYIADTLPQQLDALSRFLGTRQWFTGTDDIVRFSHKYFIIVSKLEDYMNGVYDIRRQLPLIMARFVLLVVGV
ncbi:unnamed protein product, partial [Medioppia subpectinata]